MVIRSPKKLSRGFYERDTHVVAKALLGKLLVRRWHRKKFVARISEVESYVGEDDQASHASRGHTPRTGTMYGEAGYAYVFLIYGMHHCLNVVTERVGFPAAVLIRGAVLISPAGEAGDLSGPGKLTRFLHLTLAQNGLDLVKNDRLYVADDGFTVAAHEITVTPRIGVDFAGEHAFLPWRFVTNVP